MDIAAALNAKPIERTTPSAYPSDTRQQTDDFASELEAATEELDTPPGTDTAAKVRKRDVAPKDQSRTSADKDGAATVDTTAVVAHQSAATSTPAPQTAGQPDGQASAPLSAVVTVPTLSAPEVAATAAATSTAKSTSSLEPAIAGATPDVAATKLAQQESATSAAQTNLAVHAAMTAALPADKPAINKPAAGSAKKPAEAAADPAPTAGAIQNAAPAGTPPAAATLHMKTPDQQPGADPQQGQSFANGQTPGVPAAQPTAPEVKFDASAAATAVQPASSSPQNAPTAAPALIAQNAPVFVPPEALGVVIARKALEGANKFELRLDPPEMGRLDVSLEVDETGHVRAHIRAERPEALELLQREAKGMEQALRQAGLSLDTSSLSFSLSGREGREAQSQSNQGRRAKFNAVLPEDEIHAAAIRGGAPSSSGVDLRV